MSRYVGSRFAVQRLGFDEPGTHGRIAAGASEVSRGLRMIADGLATGSFAARNRESLESGGRS